MYLTSFIHRERLFGIAERWFCGRLEPDDALHLTHTLVCDGFVIGEMVKVLGRLLIEALHRATFSETRIYSKGQLRDALCRSSRDRNPRVEELLALYQRKPDFYYREAPINAFMCVDPGGNLLGLYRIKRPRRIAEKANRRIADWIFHTVQNKARSMARERALKLGIPMEHLLTPENEMVREFIDSEELIAQSFRDGRIQFDRTALRIDDVGGIKLIADADRLSRLESSLRDIPGVRVLERERYDGVYQATSLSLLVAWDFEHVCRMYRNTGSWEKYSNRGIPEAVLRKGLEPFLLDGEPFITLELILTTFPDLVESELGNSIHEERIRAQRDNREYRGYIPMNVEFLVEYLFAVGFSPIVHIDEIPIKLWGRYLPDTLSTHIRRFHGVPEYDLFY